MPEEQTEQQLGANETAAEETEETFSEEETSMVGGGIFNLMTPEGIIMMGVAAVLDLIGLLLILFVLDDFWITDIVGTTIIGGWLFFRSGTTPSLPERAKKETEKEAEKAAAKAAKKAAEKTVQKAGAKAAKSGRWLKPLLLGLSEWVPYLGVIPFWTILVYSELTRA